MMNCFNQQHFSSFLRIFLAIAILIITSCQPQPQEAVNSNQVIVQFWTPSGGLSDEMVTTETIPGRLLTTAGFDLADVGEVRWNGQPVDIDTPLPPAGWYILQVQPHHRISLMEAGDITEFTSTNNTLGGALWEAGCLVRAADNLSESYTALLDGEVSVVLQRAIPLTIRLVDRVIHTLSSAATVGKALSQTGLSLQHLDYTSPDEGQPVPADGIIQITRVLETIQLEQETIQQQVEYRPDPETPSGEEWTIAEGLDGLQISKTRIRFENNREVSREKEPEWIAQPSQTKIIGYGTKIVISTVPGGDLDYWAAVDMYATSYYPCGFASGNCSYYTASGKRLTKGVVAVTLEWYRELKGARVYIPGYGIGEIADTGGGIPGKIWIDLGYDNENYVPWSSTVTVYFLLPAPETIPWFLR